MRAVNKIIHSEFKLNGDSLRYNDLGEKGYDLIKNGQEHEREMGRFFLDWTDSNDHLIVPTSGSTGSPKPVALRKEHMVFSAQATGDYFQLRPKDSALLCLHPKFIAGKMMLLRAMVLGMDIKVVAPSSNPLAATPDNFDFCAMVPLQVYGAMNSIERLKTLLIGGAPLSQKLRQQIQKKRTLIYETYGMTETITHIAAKRINNESNDLMGRTPFKTLPHCTVAKDERGCLVINAPQIGVDKLTTNDLVTLHSTTEFSWLGRFDNVVNSGGIKLIPEQIETKLIGLITDPFFVYGLPDEKLGKKLVLIIETDKQPSDILESLASRSALLKFEIPKEVIHTPRFKETESGKIDRTKTVHDILGLQPQ